MAIICSSHNLGVLDSLMNEFRLRLYVLKLLSNLDYEEFKQDENHWFGCLYAVVCLLEQSLTDFETFEKCLRAERNMGEF